MSLSIPVVWSVESLRVTAFPVRGTPILSPDIWWETAAGHPPDTTTKKPKEGLAQASGDILDGKIHMSITCMPERIDWQWQSSEKNLAILGFPVLGDFKVLLEDFVNIVKNWLQSECLPLQRLAFGSVLLHEVENKIEGYLELTRLLPSVQIDAEGSTDFGYSINRPRPSKLGIEGLLINRLSKWHLIAVRTLRIPNDNQDVVASIDRNIPLAHHTADEKTAPALELVTLYHQRWEVKAVFDELKTHLLQKRRVLRSKTAVLVR